LSGSGKKIHAVVIEDIDPTNKYRPTSLPHVAGMKTESIDDDDDDDDEPESRAEPTETPVRPTAATVFTNSEAMEELFFIQLPSYLPASHANKTPPKQVKSKRDRPDPNASGIPQEQFERNIHNIPEGYMGKIYVYESGKVKMKLGDIWFNINMGAECSFKQEAAVIDTEQQTLHVLGNVSKRLVCSPDIRNLLQQADERDET